MIRFLLLISTLLFLSPAQAHDPYERDLRDCMDMHYGVGMWTQRTAIGVGNDIGPAMDACLTLIRAQFGRGIIKIPPGGWLMTTAPNPSLLSGNYIIGAGSQASSVVYNNAGGAAFQFTAAGGYSGGGVKGIALLLESGLGDTGSYGIILRGDATFQPDQTSFEDIYMSAIGGSSFWYDGFHANGYLRSSPQGIRVATLTNVQVFNCRNVGIYMQNVVQFTLNNVGTYTGKGLYGNMLMLRGGAAGNSTQVYGLGVRSTIDMGAGSSDIWFNGTRYAP